MKTKDLITNKVKEEKEEMLNAWKYPTDRFMKELTLEIFANLYQDAGLETKKLKTGKFRVKQLYEIIEFVNQDNYWWRCLKEFAPTIDRKKLAKKIKERAEETIKRIASFNKLS